MKFNSVGKKSYQYADRRVWKVAKYLLLCTCYSIGISLRPTLASPQAVPPVAGINHQIPAPLTYQIVQTEPNSNSSGNLGTKNGTIELNADTQEFNKTTQIVTATGKVVVRFNQAILKSDTLQINLKTKKAIAQGNVSLLRGKQVIYGNQFEYDFEDDKGSILTARGDIYQPTLVTDLQVATKTNADIPAGEKRFPDPLLSDRLRNDQPITSIRNTSTTGGVVGSDRDIIYQPTLKPVGSINRLRFQAQKLDFVGDVFTAQKIEITNDPFSPPELLVRADRAQFKTINSEEDEITTTNSRITVENNFNIPLFRDRIVLNKLGKDPNPFNIGFDGDERGGVYVEKNFYPIFNSKFRVTVTPQYFIQSAITRTTFFDGSVFGVRTGVEANLSPNTTLQASAALTGLDPSKFNNNFRGKTSIKHNLSLFSYPHMLTGEATYRERIFNGSLGYQDVQSSFGGVLTSPYMPIGNTGVNLNYQVGIHTINANTDRTNLLSANRTNDLITLNRYQTAANLIKSFRIWEGKGLSPNDRETYNYSPVPIVPYLQINTGISGAFSGYSNGDNQSSIGYNVGIQGQFGNFSKPSFDYTGFNLSYFQQFRGNSSPFLFDRITDTQILSAGISQQLIGPFKLGIQSSLSLDTGKEISTDYYLEYSRRSYNLIIRYNPVIQLGSIGFKLYDFDWDGITPKF
jgi:lipopolysaccharide export system protein LptA